MKARLYIEKKLVHEVIVNNPEKLSYVELGLYVSEIYLYLRNKYIREMMRARGNYEIVIMRRSKMNEEADQLIRNRTIKRHIKKIYVVKKAS